MLPPRLSNTSHSMKTMPWVWRCRKAGERLQEFLNTANVLGVFGCQLKQVNQFGFDLLEMAPDLAAVPVSEWLARLDGDDLDKLTRLSGLLARRLDPARVVARLAEYPAEADRLVPLLAVAVRSLRGPEFRAGLAGVVSLAEWAPDLLPTIRQKFPELEL